MGIRNFGKHVSGLAKETTSRMFMYKIYFKELLYMIVGTGKSTICEAGQTPGKSQELGLQS